MNQCYEPVLNDFRARLERDENPRMSKMLTEIKGSRSNFFFFLCASKCGFLLTDEKACGNSRVRDVVKIAFHIMDSWQANMA